MKTPHATIGFSAPKNSTKKPFSIKSSKNNYIRDWAFHIDSHSALLSGFIADTLGVTAAILFIGVLTIASAFVIQLRMPTQTQSA
jgi:hypothetical protein